MLKVATTKGAGAVNVGKRVGATGVLYAATSVGSISTTVVAAGVGVGGDFRIGIGPNFTTLT